MNESKLYVAQLQKRDPIAWSALLRSIEEREDLMVTAVTAVPLPTAHSRYNHSVLRYTLALANCSDPITFIGKRTNRTEALFYRDVAPHLPFLAPACWFTHIFGDEAWIVLDDVANHFPPEKWAPVDVEWIIQEMARLHASFWEQKEVLQSYGLASFIGQRKYTWASLRQKQAVYFDEGPAAILSEHAINSAGDLAPLLLEAANGLAVLRSLGGWPGILSESHLAATADLLDDPVPMLQPLTSLPVTLLHANQTSHHWHLSLFDERRLLDWQKASIGPAIYDLVNFLEQFDLFYSESHHWNIQVRQAWPLSEETIIDSYMLAMSSLLNSQFNARLMRQAIPAARCLYMLTNWFPHFATWFSQMPDRYTWQKVNRMSNEQLAQTVFQPFLNFRPYLAAVFRRFLKAYRTL